MHENLVENGESDCEGICAPHKAGAVAVGCRAFATRQFTSATVFQLVDPTICPETRQSAGQLGGSLSVVGNP